VSVFGNPTLLSSSRPHVCRTKQDQLWQETKLFITNVGWLKESENKKYLVNLTILGAVFNFAQQPQSEAFAPVDVLHCDMRQVL
jgi:hypothetical protein